MTHEETHSMELKDGTPLEVGVVYDVQPCASSSTKGNEEVTERWNEVTVEGVTIIDSPCPDHVGRCHYLGDGATDSLDEEINEAVTNNKFEPTLNGRYT